MFSKTPVELTTPPHVIKTEKSALAYLHWSRYTTILKNGGMWPDGHASGSHSFYYQFKLRKYVNRNCNSFLHLGASAGKFLNDRPNSVRKIGYDYTHAAIESLNEKGIEARLVDLNSTKKNKYNEDKLSYSKQLKEDLAKPTNLFAVRVLEYLTPEAFCLLMFSLIDSAKPGTVFFLIGRPVKLPTDPEAPEQTSTSKHYAVTFFAPRTDMKILLHVKKDKDEVLVVKKLEREEGFREKCRL